MNRTRQEKQFSFQNQNRKNYFEGWYFKQVSADESVILSVIPSMMRNENKEMALIQVILAEKIDGNWKITTERLDFPMSSFHPTDDPFSLKIGNNSFSKEGIKLDIDTDIMKLSAEISFGAFTPLPTSGMSPTIMGPFSYLPFMECIHGIGSLHHTLKGYLNINEKAVSFDGGIGYIEKDWGQSFPKYYTWLQSNHFKNRPSCLFFSWADIPLGPLQFPGFICHLWINKNHYRFATYNGSKCTINKMTDKDLEVTLKKKDFNLFIKASVDAKGTLAAPKHGEMDHQIKEGLAGTIHFKLINNKTGEIIEDSSSLSGVEIVPYLIKA